MAWQSAAKIGVKYLIRFNGHRKCKNKDGDIPSEASRVHGSANHGSALQLYVELKIWSELI